MGEIEDMQGDKEYNKELKKELKRVIKLARAKIAERQNELMDMDGVDDRRDDSGLHETETGN